MFSYISVIIYSTLACSADEKP